MNINIVAEVNITRTNSKGKVVRDYDGVFVAQVPIIYNELLLHDTDKKIKTILRKICKQKSGIKEDKHTYKYKLIRVIHYGGRYTITDDFIEELLNVPVKKSTSKTKKK